MTTYYMTEANAKKSIELAAKLMKKIGKADVGAKVRSLIGGVDFSTPFYVVNGIPQEEVPLNFSLEPIDYPVVYKVEVDATGLQGSSNGWKCLGKIIKAAATVGSKNLVFLAQNTPGDWANAKMECFHCGYTRDRKATYIIGHDDGRVIQVGTGCVGEYVGNKIFTTWCEALCKFLQEIEAAAKTPTGPTSHKAPTPMYGILPILGAAAAVIEKKGWMSRASSEQKGVNSTSDRVWLILKKKPADVLASDVTGAHMDTAKAAWNWAKSLTPTSNYEQNLKTLAIAGVVYPQHVGLASAMVWSYIKSQTAKPVVPVQKFVGVVGDKFSAKVVVHRIRSYSTGFGQMFIYTFKDANNDLIVWKTSCRNLLEGDKLTLTGTIKAHTTYKNLLETEVTRCKIG